MRGLILFALLLALACARKNPKGNEHLSPEEYYEQDRSQFEPYTPDHYPDPDVPLPEGAVPAPPPPARNLRQPGQDPQPQRRRARSPEDNRRNRAEFQDQMFRCYEELTRLHSIMDQGRVLDPNHDSETTPNNRARPKSIVAHVLETVRRARIVNADTMQLCEQELLPVLLARRTPSETRAALRAGAERESSEQPRYTPNLVIEPSEDATQFDYQFIGPEGKKECTSCRCMLDWQQELTRLAVQENRSTRRLESQFFLEDNVVVVKELDVVDETVDSYFFYLARGGKVGRVEQYRARVRE